MLRTGEAHPLRSSQEKPRQPETGSKLPEQKVTVDLQYLRDLGDARRMAAIDDKRIVTSHRERLSKTPQEYLREAQEEVRAIHDEKTRQLENLENDILSNHGVHVYDMVNKMEKSTWARLKFNFASAELKADIAKWRQLTQVANDMAIKFGIGSKQGATRAGQAELKKIADRKAKEAKEREAVAQKINKLQKERAAASERTDNEREKQKWQERQQLVEKNQAENRKDVLMRLDDIIAHAYELLSNFKNGDAEEKLVLKKAAIIRQKLEDVKNHVDTRDNTLINRLEEAKTNLMELENYLRPEEFLKREKTELQNIHLEARDLLKEVASGKVDYEVGMEEAESLQERLANFADREDLRREQILPATTLRELMYALAEFKQEKEEAKAAGRNIDGKRLTAKDKGEMRFEKIKAEATEARERSAAKKLEKTMGEIDLITKEARAIDVELENITDTDDVISPEAAKLILKGQIAFNRGETSLKQAEKLNNAATKDPRFVEARRVLDNLKIQLALIEEAEKKVVQKRKQKREKERAENRESQVFSEIYSQTQEFVLRIGNIATLINRPGKRSMDELIEQADALKKEAKTFLTKSLKEITDENGKTQIKKEIDGAIQELNDQITKYKNKQDAANWEKIGAEIEIEQLREEGVKEMEKDLAGIDAQVIRAYNNADKWVKENPRAARSALNRWRKELGKWASDKRFVATDEEMYHRIGTMLEQLEKLAATNEKTK